MRLNRFVAVAGTAIVTACGAGTGIDGDADLAALQSYQALGTELSTVVSTYGTSTAAISDPAECDALHADYAGRASELAGRMREAGAAMQGHMASHGSVAAGDMICGADAVHAELERHHAAACTGGDVDADREEAARHVATMTALMEHQRVRYEEAGAGMGMMSESGDDTFTCERHDDGSFMMDGHHWEPGTVPASGEGEPTPTPDPIPTPAPWPMPCSDGHCDGDHHMM